MTLCFSRNIEIGIAIIPQIAVFQHFRDIGDLAGMIGEMFHYMNEYADTRFSKTLNGYFFCEEGAIQPVERFNHFCHRKIQPFSQISYRDGADLVKFGLSNTMIRLLVETGQNPLPDIAIEMEDQVADAVGSGIGTKPTFIFIQQVETAVYPHLTLIKQAPFDVAQKQIMPCMHHFLGQKWQVIGKKGSIDR